jgi:hypothetical protein
VSGTLGLTGAADTILIMKRQAGAVTLYVRGRDIEESEMAMQFDKSSCRWSILGTAAEVHRSAERKRVLAVLKEAGSPLQVKDIQSRAELRNRNAADMLLGKMARDGEIVRADKGRYALSETGAGQMPDRCRTDSQRDGHTDAGQIGQMDRSARQPTVLKEKKGYNPDLSAICPVETDPLAGQIDVPDLSDLSDLSGDRRGTTQTQLAMDASLASAMPVAPGKSNGRAPALGPPGDSLDDFQ